MIWGVSDTHSKYNHMILYYSITVFITQLLFIGFRTWNVRCIASGNMVGALISGAVVHIAWLISIAIGAVSMNQIITHFKWEYLPIILCSLIGGLLGTYLALKNKS